MDKELKVYKEGKGRYTLVKYDDISGRHRKLYFKRKPKDIDVVPEDVFWALKDKEANDTDQILVVHEVKPDGIICRDVDHGFIKDLRKFEEGEEFTIVATFRTVI